MKLRISVLAENTARGRGLLGEHGLACWLDAGPRRVLFDCGQGLVLTSNAYRMQIPIFTADAIVLSHGHYDHTGGLVDLLRHESRTVVYGHAACLDPKYIRGTDGSVREVGMPGPAQAAIHRQQPCWVQTAAAQSVMDGLMVTGEIPRRTDFEDVGGDFFLDRQCRRRDPLEDDQALFFETEQGTIVLLGCAHAGVINTLWHVRELTGGRPIHAVMGGMHLLHASSERLQRTLEELRQLGVQRLGPAHCTGSSAVAALRTAFPQQCFDFHVGTQLEFQALGASA